MNLQGSSLAFFAAAALVFASVPFGTTGSVPAHAQSAVEKSLVDAAKTRGQVGEQGDGYLGICYAVHGPCAGRRCRSNQCGSHAGVSRNGHAHWRERRCGRSGDGATAFRTIASGPVFQTA